MGGWVEFRIPNSQFRIRIRVHLRDLRFSSLRSPEAHSGTETETGTGKGSGAYNRPRKMSRRLRPGASTPSSSDDEK